MSRYNRTKIKEYPYKGYFFKLTIDDNPMNPDEVKELILETDCDIQSGSSTNDGQFLSASYSIFFHSSVNIKVGYLFKATVFGDEINGTVLKSFKNQIGQTIVYLTDKTV